MIRVIPILLGVLGSYLVAACFGLCDFSSVKEAAWIGLPFQWENTAFHVFSNPNWGLVTSAIIAIVPISLATMIASLFGAPANTTYGENTGVLNMTRVYDPRVIRIAAVFAIILSFCPKFSAVIACMPAATIGGVSLILYGMISAVGIRNIVENRVDFTKSRNVIVMALILVLAVGIKYGAIDAISLGFASLSGLAVAALVGAILNAVLPGKDYEFGTNPDADKAVNFEINPSLRK